MIAPTLIGAAILVVASWQGAYSRERRRLVARGWAVAAACFAASTLLAFATTPGSASIFALLTAGTAAAAWHAWKRSQFYRAKLFNRYLED